MITKFKSWLRTKLQKFLEIDELSETVDENNDRLSRSYRALQDKYIKMERLNERVVERNNIIMKEFNISADIYPRENRSWAVISINGKPEYVRFVNLSNRDMREVSHFLKQFEATNVTVDSPFQLRDMWKF